MEGNAMMFGTSIEPSFLYLSLWPLLRAIVIGWVGLLTRPFFSIYYAYLYYYTWLCSCVCAYMSNMKMEAACMRSRINFHIRFLSFPRNTCYEFCPFVTTSSCQTLLLFAYAPFSSYTSIVIETRNINQATRYSSPGGLGSLSLRLNHYSGLEF